MTTLLLSMPGPTELILLIIVALIFFGGKKIPELMRGAGRGIREFKDAMNNPTQDDDNEQAPKESTEKTEKTDRIDKK